MKCLETVTIWSLSYPWLHSGNPEQRDDNPLAWFSRNPKKWVLSAEMCVIRRWNDDYRFEELQGYSKEDEWQWVISVCYGTHYRTTVCSPPLWRKHALFQALLNESRSPYLLSALRETRDTNRPVVFLGDSVAWHSCISFLAEVKRLGKFQDR